MNKIILVLLIIEGIGCGSSPNQQNEVKQVQTAQSLLTNISPSPTPSTSIISSGIGCTSPANVGSESIILNYAVSLLVTGDKFITCSIETPWGQYTGNNFFQSIQRGANIDGCQVGASLSTDTFGYWVFTATNNIPQAIYNCPGCPSGQDQYLFVFPGSSCTINY